MTRGLGAAASALVIITVLSGCMGEVVNTPARSTSAEYQTVVDASEQLLDDAQAAIPDAAIVKVEQRVHDLETDRHRMSCSDSTSQYVNLRNVWVTPGFDAVAVLDDLRDRYLADGWQRFPGVLEQQGEQQDPEGTYSHILKSADGYGLTISRGSDTDGTTIVQLSVFSKCVGNPSDKPASWGKFAS